jgi:DEAD/DEAH box helicase domain-containing protein
MSVLVCFECRNRSSFIQVSERTDFRSVALVDFRYRVSQWGGTEARPAGVYCSRCGEPIELEPGESLNALGLADDRVDFLAYDDFSADKLADELRAQVGGAEWTSLEWPAQAARYRDLEKPLERPLQTALSRRGQDRFYTHQALAIDAARRRENVVTATGAGSGKSLGFYVPVLEAMAKHRHVTAIFVYPMKALAADQMKALAALSLTTADPTERLMTIQLDEQSEPIVVGRYDGATGESDRRDIRQSARLLIMTPDSIHGSLLRYANHRYKDRSSWSRILLGLRWVVLDEIHEYRGVFGSAVAQVVRRLRRVAEQHDGDPRFLCASATIGNPGEHARALTGVDEMMVVGPEEDGSARQRRVVLICNPPHLTLESRRREERAQQRQAPGTVALDAMSRALGSPDHLPVRAICFGRSRNEVHTFTKRLIGRLDSEYRRSDVAAAVGSYTATLLADDRGEQESRLRDGRLLGIVSTNALELGVDIPDLSLAVLVGYPGQLSTFRQRAGRVGRRGEGLTFLAIGEDPLQQHLMQAAGELLDGAPENVVISPEAPEIVRRYGLAPAQGENGLGISRDDEVYFGQAAHEWVSQAHAEGAKFVIEKQRTWWKRELTTEAYADLRNASGSGSYSVVERAGRERRTIGQIDGGSGPRDCFIDAIWVGPSEHTYQVVNVAHADKEVHVKRADVDYVTRGLSHDQTTVTTIVDTYAPFTGLSASYGELEVRRSVYGYAKSFIHGGREERVSGAAGWGPTTFRTQGFWLDFVTDGSWDPASLSGAIVGTEHLLLALLPALVAADPTDFEALSDGARIYLYDASALGIGLSRAGYERVNELIQLAHSVVTRCPCTGGCGGCVYLSRRPDGNATASKSGAQRLLTEWLSVP